MPNGKVAIASLALPLVTVERQDFHIVSGLTVHYIREFPEIR